MKAMCACLFMLSTVQAYAQSSTDPLAMLKADHHIRAVCTGSGAVQIVNVTENWTWPKDGQPFATMTMKDGHKVDMGALTVAQLVNGWQYKNDYSFDLRLTDLKKIEPKKEYGGGEMIPFVGKGTLKYLINRDEKVVELKCFYQKMNAGGGCG